VTPKGFYGTLPSHDPEEGTLRKFPLFIALLAGCQDFTFDELPDVPEEVPDIEPELIGDLVVTPSELDFGGWPLDCESDKQTITLENVGDAPITITAVDIVGPNAGAYRDSESGLTLQPGESSKVKVTFTAKKYKEYNDARIEILSDDPDTPTAKVGLMRKGADDTMM